MRVICISFYLFVALCASSASAQGTLADYKRAESFLPWNIEKQVREADVVPHWIKGTHRFWYRMHTPQGTEVTVVDADRGTRESAYDRQRISEGLFQAADIKIRADQLNIETPELMEEGKAIQFEFNGNTWTCDLKEYHCRRGEGHESGGEEHATSPNGAWRVEVKDHNLWIVDVSTGQKVQLTRDGEKFNDYTTPTPSLATMIEQGTEDVTGPAAVFWSPDSKMLLTYRMDSRNTGRFTIVQNVPSVGLRPKAYRYPYPLPGEALAEATPILFDVVHQKRINVDAAPIQGDIDGNVHPSETLRFVDALIKANKNFDMLIVPNQAHGERSNTYIIRRRWDYFVQNLLNGAPPTDFELHKAPPIPRPSNGGR